MAQHSKVQPINESTGSSMRVLHSARCRLLGSLMCCLITADEADGGRTVLSSQLISLLVFCRCPAVSVCNSLPGDSPVLGTSPVNLLKYQTFPILQ